VTGAVLPDGEKGELVFTSLTKEAFPIIRYRTRDLTRLLPGTARSMRRMEKITGRSDDMMILRGVNVFPTQIEEQLMATAGLGPHFQIELTREGRLDVMTVHVEAASGPMGTDSLEQAAESLKRRIKERVGVSVEIAAHGSGGVPRSQGKAVRIIDKRPKG
jgi:phenylacetate-CoA ligase